MLSMMRLMFIDGRVLTYCVQPLGHRTKTLEHLSHASAWQHLVSTALSHISRQIMHSKLSIMLSILLSFLADGKVVA